MRLGRRLIVVFVVALTAACGGDDGDGSVSPPSPPDDGTVSVDPPPPPPAGECDDTHRTQLTVETQNPAELEYLDDVAACTTQSFDSTLLVNNGDVVWTIDAPAGSVVQRTPGARLDSFRSFATGVEGAELLAPHSSVEVIAAPQEVEWNLHPGLSAAWVAHEQIADVFTDAARDQVTELLSQNSTRRRAFITCLFAAHDIAGALGEGLEGDAPALEFYDQLGLLSGQTDCALAWKQADAEAARVFGTTATWEDDIARLARRSQALSFADDQLRWIRTAGRITALIK